MKLMRERDTTAATTERHHGTLPPNLPLEQAEQLWNLTPRQEIQQIVLRALAIIMSFSVGIVVFAVSFLAAVSSGISQGTSLVVAFVAFVIVALPLHLVYSLFRTYAERDLVRGGVSFGVIAFAITMVPLILPILMLRDAVRRSKIVNSVRFIDRYRIDSKDHPTLLDHLPHLPHHR